MDHTQEYYQMILHNNITSKQYNYTNSVVTAVVIYVK